MKLKTLKDIKEIDNEYSGPLTPADGKDYNPKLGEPKFHESYKVSYSELRKLAKQWIRYLKKQEELHWESINNSIGENPSFEVPKGFDGKSFIGKYSSGYQERIDMIKELFNLEDDKDE